MRKEKKKKEETTEKKTPVEHAPEPREWLQGSGEVVRQPRTSVSSAKY